MIRLRNPQFLATLVQASAAQPADMGNVYMLDGATSDRFYGGNMTATPTEYTLSAWVRPSQIASTACIFVRSDGNPMSNYSHALYQNATGWKAYTFDGGLKVVLSVSTVVVGAWCHISVTAKNGGFQYLYINGVSEGTPTAISTLWTGGNDWYIGARDGNTAINYTGDIGDVAIWNKQLTLAQIQALAVPARNIPPTIEPANLILYCPTTDAPLGSPLAGNWSELAGGLSQTRAGAPIGTTWAPPPPPVPPAIENFESYSPGSVGDGSTLTGGTGWNGATAIFSYVPVVVTEDFESYSVGAVFNGSNLTNGANWNGAPAIWNY